MKSIIVFTNESSFRRVAEPFTEQQNLGRLSEDEPILIFDEELKNFRPANSFSETGIYFVYDWIEWDAFKLIVRTADADLIGFLRHTEPDFDYEKLEIHNVKKGEHEKDGRYYPKVAEILQDSGGKKAERLIHEIFASDLDLATKLRFLHDCLLPETIPDQLPPDELTNTKAQAAFQRLLAVKRGHDPDNVESEPAPINDPFAPRYIEALTELRDALLD